MPITKRTRFEVLRRDSHRCRYGFEAYRLRTIGPESPPELAPPAYAINHRYGQGVRIPKAA